MSDNCACCGKRFTAANPGIPVCPHCGETLKAILQDGRFGLSCGRCHTWVSLLDGVSA